jgi:muconolactone delta-isomerase
VANLYFGGMRAGVRSAVLIFDVESHNELDKLLFSIPIFNFLGEMEIAPLNSIEERQTIVEEQKKASMK